MTFKDIAENWVKAGCQLVEINKDNPKMYVHGVKAALWIMLDNFAKVPVVEWHPYPQEKPTRRGNYLVTLNVGGGKKMICVLCSPQTGDFNTDSVLAWAELPEPYKGD